MKKLETGTIVRYVGNHPAMAGIEGEVLVAPPDGALWYEARVTVAWKLRPWFKHYLLDAIAARNAVGVLADELKPLRGFTKAFR